MSKRSDKSRGGNRGRTSVGGHRGRVSSGSKAYPVRSMSGPKESTASRVGATTVGSRRRVRGSKGSISSQNLVFNGIFEDLRGVENVINGGFDADTDWTKGTGWTIAAAVASHIAGLAANEDLSQLGVYTTSAPYFVQLEVTSYTTGDLNFFIGAGNGMALGITGTGIYAVDGIAASDDLFIRSPSSGPFTGDIDNVSVKEDLSGWVKGDGWSILGGVANCDGSQAASSDLLQTLPAVLTPGITYQIEYTVSDYVSGNVTPRLTGTANTVGTPVSANGTFIDILTAPIGETTNTLLFRASFSASFSGNIDSVSIREVLT